jgi:hypothetical protein
MGSRERFVLPDSRCQPIELPYWRRCHRRIDVLHLRLVESNANGGGGRRSRCIVEAPHSCSARYSAPLRPTVSAATGMPNRPRRRGRPRWSKATVRAIQLAVRVDIAFAIETQRAATRPPRTRLPSRARVGCLIVADVHNSAVTGRVEPDGGRRFVHYGLLFSIVTRRVSVNRRNLEDDGRHDSRVVCSFPLVVPHVAIGRGHNVGDGCAFADVRCDRLARLRSPSCVVGNRVHDGCTSAVDGCLGAADGCSLAADIPDGAAAVRVDADARRGFVRHRPLVATVSGELSGNGREVEHDGWHDAPVLCELARVAREDEADECEQATFDRGDAAVGREGAADGRKGAAVGCRPSIEPLPTRSRALRTSSRRLRSHSVRFRRAIVVRRNIDSLNLHADRSGPFVARKVIGAVGLYV